MLKIKPGAKVGGLRSEMILAAAIAEGVYRAVGADCVITEGTGGKHGRHSHHYKGLAIDLRTRNVDTVRHVELKDRLQNALGPEYQVILEPDHIHIEYDPA